MRTTVLLRTPMLLDLRATLDLLPAYRQAALQSQSQTMIDVTLRVTEGDMKKLISLLPSLVVASLSLFALSSGASEAPVTAARVQTLYKTYCDACHGDGKLGAPIPGKIEDWGERLMAGVDGLLAATKKGLKNMPANGGCSDCSDAELQATIEWMSEDRASSAK